MNSWTLPGQSSIKARVLHFQDRIEYSWTRGEISKQWPVTIEIHPTNRCNLRCEFCSYNEIRSDGKMLPNDVFERLITSLIECYPTLTSVVFSGGGEPSTHPYLPTAINRLSKAGIDVGIITNGVHMNDDLFESYCRSTWVRFSLDVPSEDVYVKLMSRHKPDNFKKVLKNIRRLSDAKDNNHEIFPTLGIGYIITRDCQDDDSLMKCLEIGDEVGADYIMYRPLVNYNNVQISRPLSELELLKEKIESRSNELGIAQQFKKFIKEFERTVDQKVPTSKKECPIVHDGLAAFVAATGDVVPCYAIYQHKMSQAWSYGNINETDFKEIWNNKLREEVISKIDARKCPFCRFQGHNKIIQNMSEGILPNYGREDKHWKFL